MKDQKIMDFCFLCAANPVKECEKHKAWVREVRYSNILTDEEMQILEDWKQEELK